MLTHSLKPWPCPCKQQKYLNRILLVRNNQCMGDILNMHNSTGNLPNSTRLLLLPKNCMASTSTSMPSWMGETKWKAVQSASSPTYYSTILKQKGNAQLQVYSQLSFNHVCQDKTSIWCVSLGATSSTLKVNLSLEIGSHTFDQQMVK